MTLNKHLVDQNFVQDYLADELKKIIKEDYSGFTFKIYQHYSDAVRYEITVQVNGQPLKMIGVGKADGNLIKKNYEIAQKIAQSQSVIKVYKPLDYDEKLKIFFYEFVDGESFRNLVEDKKISSNTAIGYSTKIISAIESLKKVRVEADGLEKLNFQELAEELSDAVLNRYPNLETTVNVFKNLLQKFNFDSNCLVHGDFQAGNIIINGGITIIDWDNAFLGENGYDLGTFLAHTDLMFDYHYGSKIAQEFIEQTLEARHDRKLMVFALYTYLKIINFSARDDLARKIADKMSNLVGYIE